MSDNLHDCEAEGEHDEAARDHAGDCSALADVNQEPGNADCNAAPEGSANNLRGGGGTRAGRQPSAMTVPTPARQTARPRTRHSGQRPLRGALARGSWKAGRGASRKKRKAAQAGGASQALARSTSSRVPQRPKQLPPRTGIALARPWRQARVGAAGCEPGRWLCRTEPRPSLHRAAGRHGNGTQETAHKRTARQGAPGRQFQLQRMIDASPPRGGKLGPLGTERREQTNARATVGDARCKRMRSEANAPNRAHRAPVCTSRGLALAHGCLAREMGSTSSF